MWGMVAPCPSNAGGVVAGSRGRGLLHVVANPVGSFSLVEVFAAALVCALPRPVQLRAFVRMHPSA